MLFISALFISAAFLGLTKALQVDPTTADGIYAAQEDGTIVRLGNLPANTTTKRDLVKSAKFSARDIDGTPPGYVRCEGAVLNDLEWSDAANAMAGYCGDSQTFHSAIYSYSKGATGNDGVVAYVCAYSGKGPGDNKCDKNSAEGWYGAVNKLQDPMNGLPSAPLARPRSSGGSIGDASFAPLSSPISTNGKIKISKRRHDQTDPGSSSAESLDEAGAGKRDRRRLPGVKRACNECRQQKLKCDVITEPTIDTNFKRVGKRSRHAEMEREIEDLKHQLEMHQSATSVPKIKAEPTSPTSSPTQAMDAFMGHEDAAASLMDLASGQEAGSFARSPGARIMMSRRLGDISLSMETADQLFQIYFSCYHPFLPILNNLHSPDDFYDSSKLLYWTIIAVAARRYQENPSLLTTLTLPLNKLLWEQIGEVPQNYLFCKAVCLLCTWPLPISSTSSDPTFILSGLNVHVAMQMGLHRPSHVQDFSKFNKAELMEEDLRDRVRTWAACNAIASRVSTAYGQPPATCYDWTLAPSGEFNPGFILPKDAQNRLLIERFSGKITEVFYRNPTDPEGIVKDEVRVVIIKMFVQDYIEVERCLVNPDQFSYLYLRAAGLHLRLSIFFASPQSKDYKEGLNALWEATILFLETALHIDTDLVTELLAYATNYVLQMIIASAFTLLKLLNSSFANFVNVEYGRGLFTEAVRAIRTISVASNDLPSRLAEVLAQLWKSSGAGKKQIQPTSNSMESSLQLKVKCRMSMSLVFDSVWRWRDEFQAKGRGNLEGILSPYSGVVRKLTLFHPAALKNPTNPDSNAESSANSVVDGNLSLAPSVAPLDPPTSGLPPTDGFGLGEGYNEVFDPLNWMFDGLVEFPSLNGLGGMGGMDDLGG
ncbi:uncharacterized protein KY384_001357 [Bacidia gigantensis]|uniref:uncharacterized protein n=1 Tax=Bacidia gigantensis TaxID=2732470 RepID=UPI001D05BB6A|nr:uncharacterized protein KY384_001357 [Bacidia gigantensis]KAG8533617.1 hypothetical protein KY384_001357 [Bacidia gigantensis]